MKTAPDKNMKISSEEHKRPNSLEYLIIVSIVDYFSGLCLLCDSKKVANIYHDGNAEYRNNFISQRFDYFKVTIL